MALVPSHSGATVIDEDVAAAVASRLGGRSVAVAESCTAGRIAAVLACVEGATAWLRGGVVAYQEEVKRSLLGVAAPLVLSQQAVVEMAAGACRALGAEVAVSTSGLAGGHAADGVEPGTVFVGTCVDGVSAARVHRFDGDAQSVCDQARRRALLDLLERLDPGGEATDRPRPRDTSAGRDTAVTG